ncbi:MAG: hypothetical protein K6D38_07265 [Pseudobutyrivibrio sp.]|nr:hypothetical protein [Pseudobutyrivibrio sp.]
MPRADRASQFMPFAALKGYEEALRLKEINEAPQGEPSDIALDFMEYEYLESQVELSQSHIKSHHKGESQ